MCHLQLVCDCLQTHFIILGRGANTCLISSNYRLLFLHTYHVGYSFVENLILIRTIQLPHYTLYKKNFIYRKNNCKAF